MDKAAHEPTPMLPPFTVPDHASATGDGPSAGGFMARLEVAPVGAGYSERDHWVWGGSAIRGDDGHYHLFASRWPKTMPFNPYWVTNSQVVRAVSKTPAGPYRFAGVVLGGDEPTRWDGRMAHNPTIHRCPVTGRFLLFYTGTTYEGPRPVGGELTEAKMWEAQGNQRIGLAVADRPEGPWTRFDRPVLSPRPGKWDARIATNPAACVLADGGVLLAYKSQDVAKAPTSYGMAKAQRYDQPFERLRDDPVFEFDDPEASVEDAYLWREAGRFHMIFKDRTHKLTGENSAGVYASSEDAIHWRLGEPCKAYSRRVRWSDGRVTVLGSLERPQLLIQDGVPTHFFAAAADGPGGFARANHTWNQCIPLRPHSSRR